MTHANVSFIESVLSYSMHVIIHPGLVSHGRATFFHFICGDGREQLTHASHLTLIIFIIIVNIKALACIKV